MHTIDSQGGFPIIAAMLGEVIKSMRPHQWVKNSFVLAPLIFSRNLTSLGLLWRASAGMVLFCIASGAVYIINDLFDREQDREHPSKQHRPIASGRLSVSAARNWATVSLVLCVGVGAWLRGGFAVTLIAYVIMNLAYSVRLKHVAFLDVTIIGLGFLLRVLAGALVIDVATSRWLIVCTFLLSLYLALGKRKHELVSMGSEGSTRKVLQMYRLNHIRLAMVLIAIVTAVCYTAYTFDPITVTHVGTSLLPLTVPFIAIGLFRFHILTQKRNGTDSPTEKMVRDPIFLGNILAWGLVVVILIYVVK